MRLSEDERMVPVKAAPRRRTLRVEDHLAHLPHRTVPGGGRGGVRSTHGISFASKENSRQKRSFAPTAVFVPTADSRQQHFAPEHNLRAKSTSRQLQLLAQVILRQ